MTTKPKLIITADDFGRDSACTTTIAQSLADGLITSTSLMANGRAFEQASALAQSNGLTDRIGVHLCLDEGIPLSSEMARLADPNGHLMVQRSLLPLSATLATAIEAELSAQIERVLAAGIRPTYLDSHRHIHTSYPIARIVVRLAKRYGISYVRPARNLAGSYGPMTGLYKWIFNSYLSRQVRTADRFADIVEMFERRRIYSLPPSGCVVECMTHLDDSSRGRHNLRLLRDPAFLDFLTGYQLVAHRDAFPAIQ